MRKYLCLQQNNLINSTLYDITVLYYTYSTLYDITVIYHTLYDIWFESNANQIKQDIEEIWHRGQYLKITMLLIKEIKIYKYIFLEKLGLDLINF